jgi:hypothetical protein
MAVRTTVKVVDTRTEAHDPHMRGVVVIVVMLGALVAGCYSEAVQRSECGPGGRPVTLAEVSALELGMTVDEVKHVLGKPACVERMLSVDDDRTTVLYYDVDGGEPGAQYRLTFVGARLDRKAGP